MMQIACPACAASYQVPDPMIGAGRQMRCVRCGDEWFAKPPMPEVVERVAAPAPPPAVPRPVPAAVAPEPAPPRPATRDEGVRTPRRNGPWLVLAWLLSLAAWAGALYGLWAAREPLSELWPPIIRLYALFGLD